MTSVRNFLKTLAFSLAFVVAPRCKIQTLVCDDIDCVGFYHYRFFKDGVLAIELIGLPKAHTVIETGKRRNIYCSWIARSPLGIERKLAYQHWEYSIQRVDKMINGPMMPIGDILIEPPKITLHLTYVS